MRVTVVIPARGGSDRVPYLNIRRLGDAPLLAHTIRAAKEAKGIDRIIVSTDDETVAEVARAHGAEVPFLRPKELSGDLSSLMPVVRHAVTESEKGHRRAPTWWWSSRPPHPSAPRAVSTKPSRRSRRDDSARWSR